MRKLQNTLYVTSPDAFLSLDGISIQCVLLLKNRRLFVIIIQSRQRIFVGFNAAPRTGRVD